MAGQPLVNVDETAPLRPDSPAPYPWSKAKAEQAVRDANGDGFETVVIRPRFVWGRGDTVLLPRLTQMVRSGQFAWIGGGGQLTSTAHVENVAEGLVLGAERGQPGGVYFITDGDPVVFREFVGEMLRTQGVEPPSRNLPAPLALAAAVALETASKTFGRPRQPPLTRFAVWVSSQECTIDISKARDELGYAPIKSREDGMRELAAAGRAEAA
jgi:nucleoside-diphosphate-sugar epimerase